MSRLSDLKELVEEIKEKDGICLSLDFIHHTWARSEFDIYWNTDDNLEELLNGEGNTYSVERRSELQTTGDYLCVTGDNGCGEQYSCMFYLPMEVASAP